MRPASGGRAVVAGLLAALALGAHARPACLDEAVTTVDMQDCLARAHAAADARLNAAYAGLRQRVGRGERDALLQAQRDWLRWRDSNCRLHRTLSGGTQASVSASLCLERLTRERADELEGLRR